jgi:hypothetical protein
MNRLAVEDENKLDSYYDFLNEKLNFEILGNPHNSIMDSEWFYDTNFHLNDAGAITNTKQLIKDIKLAIDDVSATNIVDPEKPEIIENEEDKDGDNSDVDCFSYQLQDDRYIITSITNEKENMIVPYRYQGKKVIAFNADVFAFHSNIKTIKIQDNIRYLYDYSFDGCSSLEKIYLENKNPASINIGAYLLDGCSADIYVPEEAYGSYIFNYNFAPYTSRIKK